jgi:para-nitrobenzyl esterase
VLFTVIAEFFIYIVLYTNVDLWAKSETYIFMVRMKTIVSTFLLSCFIAVVFAQSGTDNLRPVVKTANGTLEGMLVSGIRIFKGIPYAQPPVGDLRWKEPEPVKNWEGILLANHFSARPMQLPLYSDMNFRSPGISEDCLYLNIWTPANSDSERLPVLVYFYGGGLNAGDGSEYRYDGESMARRGVVSVTVNYRLGVFGFLAHPELTKESVHHASGNYGFMDQTEALRWIHKNIAAFGGDPENMTIGGESAGSSSVNAQVVSPLARNLFNGAIGESGSVMKSSQLISLREAEEIGSRFEKQLDAHSIKDLRVKSAEQILRATIKPGIDHFPIDVDGYFFPESPIALYQEGKVANVALLVGWNSEEANWKSILGDQAPTKENYESVVRKLYPIYADAILKLYWVENDSDVQSVATALAGDRQNALGSWKWSESHSKTNNPVYRYFFIKPRPGLRTSIMPVTETNAVTGKIFKGAVHSAEIEYALGNLPSNRVYDWTAEDYTVSAIMQDYFLNFIKTKNPNGAGLPYWPLYKGWQKDPVMYIGEEIFRGADKRDRYLLLDKIDAN